MLITCPECNFTRDVRDDKLPERAQVATCPKCKHKFKFRDLPPLPPEQSTQDDPPQEGLNREEPAAEGMREEPAADTAQEQRQPEQAAPPQPESEAEPESLKQPEDLWGKLESMHPEESSEPDEDEEEVLFSGQDSGPDMEIPVPFEQLQEYGFFPGLFETIKRAMFSPRLFFAVMPLAGFARPLIFFILISELQLAAETFWLQAGLNPLTLPLPGFFSGNPTTPEKIDFMAFIYYPLILTPLLFIGSGLNHVFLALVGAANRGYEATFRALAYSGAPAALSLVPVVGSLAGWFWSIVITVIAFKYVHRTTYSRVAASLLILTAIFSILFYYLAKNHPLLQTMALSPAVG